MPPKRKPAVFKKANQLLVTRLMQISLEVDKHVYSDQPISVTAARSFVSELLQLSNSSGQDARTKQVIEKLTRQMKSIITENENTFVPLSQDITEQPLDVLQTTETKHLPIEADNSHTNNVIDINMNNPTNVSEEIIINKSDTISNSTQNAEVPTSFESQSIITNNAVDLVRQNKEQTVLKDILNDQIISKIAKVKPKFLPPTKLKKMEKKKTDMATFTQSDKTNVTFEINSQNIFGDETETDNIDYTKTKGRKKAKMQKKVNSKPKNINENKDNKETNRVTKKVDFTVNKNEPKKRQNTGNRNTDKQNSTPSITSTENNEKDSVLTQNNDVNFYNNSIKPVAIQEDLSWIENIKYVREIAVDELIPTATSKSFWENLTFAGQINTEDFL